ncbi:MAG TPA: hypothetical protein VG603_13630, partial [Chitinophagales bacterium]|nr:hypothetical protein [Chitinophagales bacterium]
MVVLFGNTKVYELYALDNPSAATKYKLTEKSVDKYKLRIEELVNVPDVDTLKQLLSLDFKKASDGKGKYCIRINDRYNLYFDQASDRELVVKAIGPRGN